MTRRKRDESDVVRFMEDGTPRCTGRAKTTGQQCRKAAMKGGTVCRNHGGNAPQVKRAATLRLMTLVDPAIATLAREMATASRSSDRQAAANSILDRAGHGRATKIEDDAIDLLIQMIREGGKE